MKKYLFLIFFLAFVKGVAGQLTTEDINLMTQAINLFKKDLNANYWIVSKSYDNNYRERPEFVKAALTQFASNKNVSGKSRLEILEDAKVFNVAELPDLEHSIKVDIDSKEIDLLCGIYSVSAASVTDVNKPDQKKAKTREEAEKETLSFYKDYYRLAEIKALEVSEPFYNKGTTNAIIIITE